MIKELQLGNFKCFRDQRLAIGGITLLSGLNGMGKSSVLQTLLLLRQSHALGILETRGLALNGDLVRLGSASDALFEDADEDEVSFHLTTHDATTAKWVFHCDATSDVLPLTSGPGNHPIYAESLFSEAFHYLQAERTGPRTAFQMSDSRVIRERQLGIAGEYCAHFLSAFERERISLEGLAHPDAVSLDLRDQAEAWLAAVSPGTRIHVTPHASMDLVNLQFSFKKGTGWSDTYRATNVGFGLTYTLPVVVATLASSAGSLLLIENPEAHLHPRGQMKIAEMLAQAAAAGVQVIVETHSDHVLNGVRLAVHGGVVPAEVVQLHFFRRAKDEMRTEVLSPVIDRKGRIDRWPADFFDEWDKSLDILLG